jgi:hypothetical protein
MNSFSWELEKNKNGIKIYTRSTDQSRIKEFKAITTVNAKRIRVAEIIARITDYVNWYPDCSDAKILEEISSTERKVYYRIDLPWPTADRDIIMNLKVKVNNEKKETLLLFTQSSGGKKKVDGVVRMTFAKGYWKLVTEGSQTKVHYQFIADPGGSLPDWIINMFLVDGPYDTLVALKKKLNG